MTSRTYFTTVRNTFASVDNGKLGESRGRKATGLETEAGINAQFGMAAGLPIVWRYRRSHYAG